MRVPLVVLLTVCGCRCRERPAVAPPAPPPTAATTWAPHEVSEAPEDVYGVPAWSKVFALAFERKVSIGVPACAVSDAGCLGRDPTALRSEPMEGEDRVLGHDEPLAFIGEQVTFLQDARRRARLEAAIAEALTVDPSTAPVAAVLFQHDLWERVDAISAAIAQEPGADWAALEALRTRLVALMRHLALSDAQLAALPSNEAAVTRAFPELLAGFDTREGWGEVVFHSTERAGSSEWRHTTRHAERHGYRMAFRVFVHHPDGVPGVAEAVRTWPAPLPEGARVVLTGAPLVLGRDGAPRVAPFITLLETRQVMGAGFVASSVGALPNDVLEGRRSTLTRHLGTGGLQRLARDALLPVGATCMPDFTSRLPAATTCLTCHGPTGARLTGPMAHGEIRAELAADSRAAGLAVVEAKRRAPSFLGLGW